MDAEATRLEPPFEKWVPTAEEKQLKVVHPAAVAFGDDLISPSVDMKIYLEADLIPKRLDRVYRHLHYAGPPRFARPLHRQKLLGRDIVITENISEHLVWYQSKIFIKPLSVYLLDYDFWKDRICSESDDDLYKSACGMLLSYVWLVSRESDFRLARDEMYLLPKELEWERWASIMTSFTKKINTKTLHQVSRRYEYGELRLSRLNRIYRYSPLVFSATNLFRGFLWQSSWCHEVFHKNFGWLLAVFAFFSVSLSGLQVAIATDQLAQNRDFRRASYGFTVFSLVAIAASVVIMVMTWFILTAYFYVSAKLYHHRVQSIRRRRRNQLENAELG